MTQVPLAPPPPTGGPLDGWLYLLWRRLTQAGQILWESITPGTSADVAAAVTDETGSPGSLVFSGNPTVQGITVDGIAYIGDSTALAGIPILSMLISTNTNNGTVFGIRKAANGTAPPNFNFIKARGTALSPSVISTGDNLGLNYFYAYDGTNYVIAGEVRAVSEGTISTGIVPMHYKVSTANSSGVVTEALRIDSSQVVTIGGASTTPALKVTPVASQARWIEVTGATSSTNPTIGVSGGNLATSAVFMPLQATTAGAPAYVLGGMYFDTTLNKLRIGGAAAWETVTSV